MPYGEYELQVYKYQPLAYWRVGTYASASSEASVYGSNAELAKSSSRDGYKSPVYSSIPGTNLLFATNTLTISSTEFDKLKLGKSSYSKQPFTINFWLKDSKDTIDTANSVFKIGTKINLYRKNGMFMLDFLGQKTYVEVDSHYDLKNISILYDGSRSSLVVNGIVGETISSISDTFEASPSAVWTAGTDEQLIVKNISVFGYAATTNQSNYLYTLGSGQLGNIDRSFSNLNVYGAEYSMPAVTKTLDYKPTENNIVLRNCFFKDNRIYMLPKKPATINGASFGTSGFAFSGTDNIYIDINERDIDIRNCSFSVESPSFTSKTGTLLYINANKYIKVTIESGNYKVYTSDSSSAIFTQAVSGADSIFSINFIDGRLLVDIDGVSTETGYNSPYSFNSVTIGNNQNGDDPFSGEVSDFTINYADNPLQIGLYSLDLSASYTSYIVPKQDGVAMIAAYFPAGTGINYLTFKSAGGTDVQVFDGSNTLSDYLSCSNGTSIISGEEVLAPPIASDTPFVVSARLISNTNSSDVSAFSMPKIVDLNFIGFNDKKIYMKEIDAYFSSTHDHPYNLYTDRIYAYQDFTIVNNSYQISTIFMKIRPESLPSTGTILSIGSTNLTLTKLNGYSYTLSSDNGSTLTVNGTSGQTLYIHDEVSIVLQLASAQNLNISIAMHNFEIKDIGFSNTSGSYFDFFKTKYPNYDTYSNIESITDASTASLTDSVIAKAFTSNIIISG